MEQIANDLAQQLFGQLLLTPPTQRLIVGIAGVPASGKSTLSKLLLDKTNELWRKQGPRTDNNYSDDVVVLVGLDGWHLTRAQLDAFPDPKHAHDRRGAHWTFDGESYVEFMQQLRQPLSSKADQEQIIIHAPSFSHELKDPTPLAIPVFPHHRLIIIEGLYTFLGIEPWIAAGKMLDERWWVELGEDEARARLLARHVSSGVAKDLEEAEWRARENDAPNGRFIKEHMLEPTKIIRSVEDPVCKTPPSTEIHVS